MYTVGRLGSYITRGVYSFSAPFHPFGGAVDIIVVEQQDGSFKSSPWYVRFGKFQGVLKSKEKIVTISVDGVQADFHMYLDNKGEAYFLREVDGEEGDSVFRPSSSGEEIESKSCNFDSDQSNLVTQIDIGNGKILTRRNSRRSRILGLVLGRKSMKGDSSRVEEDNPGVIRADSLQRAEIAADLLEVNWSTNLTFSRHKEDGQSQFPALDISKCELDKGFPINEGQVDMNSHLHHNTVDSLHNLVLHEEIDIHDRGLDDRSWVGFSKLRSLDNDLGIEMSCLDPKHIIGTSSLGKSGMQENYDLNTQTVREVDELGVVNANRSENAKDFIPKTTNPDPGFAGLDEEQVFKEKDILLPCNGLSKKESGADRFEAFGYSEILESPVIGFEDSGGKSDETLNISCSRGVEVCAHAKTLNKTAEPISEISSVQVTSLFVAKDPVGFHQFSEDGDRDNCFSDAEICGREVTSSNSSKMVTVDQINLLKVVESSSIYPVYGFNNSIYEVKEGENTRDVDLMRNLQYSLKPAGVSQEFRSGCFATEATTISPLRSREEEQLLFSDPDDFNHGEVKCMESIPSNPVGKEDDPPVSLKCSESVIESLYQNDELFSSPHKFVQENMLNDVQENPLNDIEDFRVKSRTVSSCISIPRTSKVAGEDFKRMAESLPNMWSRSNDLVDLVVDDLYHSLGHSLDANIGSSKWTPIREELSSCVRSDGDKDDQVFVAQPTVDDAHIAGELKNRQANLEFGNSPTGINAADGSWRVWPFTFKRPKSMKATQPAQNSTRSSEAENTLESSTVMDGENDVLKLKIKRIKVRAITPTPEQLASLNLKEGKNTVTFTFSTSMLGSQQVDARIYLWKWDTRVVISDVDGTITKSDVLGQFMPLVGRDWSQTGVAHLFSAIKENGYQLLFLSSRAISQAYHTRQFLFNLKQNGKALPDGPVVISPDGLFPSLFREVIRRAPHEFKIACLEDIRALFPSDHNPFYAGFGNRDTDEISYLKVGIPKGKIFIINPKGEVAVNHRVDTKSYTSLHALVHDMFPPMSSSEQEDFNSWNFWRLPPPAIDL
ncbi:phosphatidate phosphatase [Sarracenia purpurea var. burkii]